MPRKERHFLRFKKENPNQKIQVASRVDLELYSFIEKQAKKRDKTISNQVSYFLELGITTFKNQEGNKKTTKEMTK